MSFLYPTFLWALTALSIPIIIHLFNFRKTKRIYFSNTRFLKQVKEVTTSKRRIKHYLILASRLLFLLFLVLAFAQPVIPARDQMAANRNIILYIDNSLSMSAQLADKKRALDAAINFAHDITSTFPQDTRYKLITNDFAPFSNTFKNKAEVQDLLTQIRLSPVSRSAEEVKMKVSQDRALLNTEVFWISDFQISTMGALTGQLPDTLGRWHMVPVLPEVNDNVFIDSAYLENPFAIGQEKNSLHIVLRNDGEKNIDQLNVKLTINNVQAATASVSITAGGQSEAVFDLASGLTGLNEARISFNDNPVNFDNDFFAALNFKDKVRVIEIKASDEVTAIQTVYGNKEVFTYRGFSVDNFNYSLLQEADLVVINGVNTLNNALSLALRNYIDNSGSLLFIPGEAPEMNSYRNFLQLPALQQVAGPEFQELDRPDFNNPFFENVFEERTVSLSMPSARSVLDWGNDRAAILRFKDNKPYLSLFEQSGNLFILSSPLQRSHTDLMNQALFVPVMYRIAANSKKNLTRLYYTLQENFVSLTIDSLFGEDPVKLKGEQEIVPSQRKVGDQLLLELPRFSMSQGFYHVVVQEDTLDLLAFNLDQKESLMAHYAMDEIRKAWGVLPNVSIFKADSIEAFGDEIEERYLGKPLWKYALMLALIFLLAEILLIRFLK